MPRYCLYPQNTQVKYFLPDGTPNPQRCPYRTYWKPHTTSANNLCCKKSYVLKDDRADKRNKWIPPTHAHFSDDRPPSPSPPRNPRSCINQSEMACGKNKRCRRVNLSQNEYGCAPMKWGPNRNCPAESQCTEANCLLKNDRRRVCSDKYRCVLESGAAGVRSCKAALDEEVPPSLPLPLPPPFNPPPPLPPPFNPEYKWYVSDEDEDVSDEDVSVVSDEDEDEDVSVVSDEDEDEDVSVVSVVSDEDEDV